MLITLIEFTLGPIWVWLVFAEQPTRIALIGGLIVLSAVAARALLMMYQERKHPSSLDICEVPLYPHCNIPKAAAQIPARSVFPVSA
ncbi:MAG: hypothetical protein CM1200mP18_11030 [Gammaproteobacteria bacterium]|nr:MAG: hypothetical protein CM1200mP18_11030 [Gammaproteobacteria bacterium]